MWSPSAFFLLVHVSAIVYSIYGKEKGRRSTLLQVAPPRRQSELGALWSFRRAESTCRYVLDTSYGRYIITVRLDVNQFFELFPKWE